MAAVAEPKRNDNKGKKPFRNFAKKLEEKGIPMWKFGKSNNFYKFRVALSNEATERYGNLGKLINLEKYYALSFVLEDYTAMGFSVEQAERMNLENSRSIQGNLPRWERIDQSCTV
jgi:hypothetical protein